MEFRNHSNHGEVGASINKAIPIDPQTVVARLGIVAKGSAKSADIAPGPVYYIYVATTNTEPYPAGTTIAQMGGVYADSTVTLNENDSLIIN